MGKILFLTCTVALLITWGPIDWNQKQSKAVQATPALVANTEKSLTKFRPLTADTTSHKNSSPKVTAVKPSDSKSSAPKGDEAPPNDSDQLDLSELRDTPKDDLQTTIATELNRAQVLNNAWLEEKKQFYQEKLHLSDDEIHELYSLDEVADEAIRELTQKLSDNPAETSEQEYMDTVQRIVATYEQDAHTILGDDGIVQMKEFRERFNDKSYARFGTHVKQMGF